MGKTQPLLFHQEDNKSKSFNSSGTSKIITAVIMILASCLPYFDWFIDIFTDTKKISVPRFQNLSYAIWAYGTAISPLLVLFIAKVLKPVWWAYIVTIYVNVSAILAYIYLQLNINIESDYVFRAINLVMSIILLLVFKKTYDYYKLLKLKNEILRELENNK